jgi:outer membrane protein assembly factor BamB
VDQTQSAVLYCRDGFTGALKWSISVPGAVKQFPFAVSGSTVYVGVSLDNGYVFSGAYRLSDGSQLWNWTGGVNGQQSTPISVLLDGTRVAIAGEYPADAATPPSAGVLYFDSAGTFLQKVLVAKKPGSTRSDRVFAAASDNAGNAFLVGTFDVLPAEGDFDYLVARIGAAPPSAGGGGGGGGCLSMSSRSGDASAVWNWLIFLGIPVVFLGRKLFRGGRKTCNMN